VPAREVSLQPEVQGRVIYRSESLVPGGTFKKGEVLLRIDSSEYNLRAQKSATEVEQAIEQLKLEQSRGEVAAHEWTLIGGERTGSQTGREVALRMPQMKEAETRIALAQNAQDLAQLNVGRTTLRAPFNGLVKSGQVQVGQYVSPNVPLGTLVGSDEYWVQVSVPMEQLKDIFVPGFNAKEGEGSVATVWQEMGNKRISREGRVVRLYGDVDPMGRLSRVLVNIVDPLQLGVDQEERGVPLLLGSYVHVDIEGHEMVDVIEVPRAAVHGGRYVYVYGEGDRLLVKDVEIAWRRPQTFLLRSGLAPGDEIIVSRMGAAVEGLKLRRAATETATAAKESEGTVGKSPQQSVTKVAGPARKESSQ
jgi:RND family efflux transporter MFP subunit